MAMNAREAHAMLAASRRNPSQIAQMKCRPPMTLPVDRTIADTIAGGAIGNVIAIDLCSLHRRLSQSGPAAALAAEPRFLSATTSWRFPVFGTSRWRAG